MLGNISPFLQTYSEAYGAAEPILEVINKVIEHQLDLARYLSFRTIVLI